MSLSKAGIEALVGVGQKNEKKAEVVSREAFEAFLAKPLERVNEQKPEPVKLRRIWP